MIYAVIVGVAEALAVRYVWLRYGVIEKDKNRAAYVVSTGVGVLAIVMNLLLCYRQCPFLKYANLAAVFTILVMAAGIDFRKYLIPNRLILVGMAVRTALLAAEVLSGADASRQSLVLSGAGLALGLILMLFLSLITRHGIGYGDVKLFAWLGYSIGIKDAYSVLFYGVLFAAVMGILLLASGKADKKKKLPFAPFIFAGCYAVILMSLL